MSLNLIDFKLISDIYKLFDIMSFNQFLSHCKMSLYQY